MSDRIKEIKARLAAATPGPWMQGRNPNGNAKAIYLVRNDGYEGDPIGRMGGRMSDYQSPIQLRINAEFVANAPEDIAYLVPLAERAEELEAENERLRARDDYAKTIAGMALERHNSEAPCDCIGCDYVRGYFLKAGGA